MVFKHSDMSLAWELKGDKGFGFQVSLRIKSSALTSSLMSPKKLVVQQKHLKAEAALENRLFHVSFHIRTLVLH